MMERRKEPRTPLRMVIDCSLSDEKNLNLWTTNISKTGIGAKWLKWWDCRSCENCLDWIYGIKCKLEKCDKHSYIEEFKPGTTVKLKGMFGDDFTFSEKQGKIVWLKNSDDSSYIELGINFIM